MLVRMFEKRLRGYKALGYSIHAQEQRPEARTSGTSNSDNLL
jgi:hypothetical protein